VPAGTLEVIARELGHVLQPLEQKLASGQVIQLFGELGVQFPPALLSPSFVNALNNGVSAANKIAALIGTLSTAIDSGSDTDILNAGIQLIQQAGATIAAVDQIGTQLSTLAGSLPGLTAAQVNDFAAKLTSSLLSYLVIVYIESRQSGVAGILNLLGVIDELPNPGVTGDPVHPPYLARTLHLSRIGDLFQSPANLAKSLYGWGDPGVSADTLVANIIPRLSRSLALLGVPAQINPPGPLPPLDSTFLSIKPNPASSPPGIIAGLKMTIDDGWDVSLPLSSTWSVHMLTHGKFAAGLQAIITPPATLLLQPPSGTLNGQLLMELKAQGTAGHPLILLGQTGGSRLQTDSFSFSAGATVTWDAGSAKAAAEPVIQFAVAGGKAVIDMSQADGFLATVTSGIHVEAGFDFKGTWRPDTGLHLEGAAQLELALPLHLTLGPITLPTLYLVSGFKDGGIPIEVSVALGLALGPIQASIDRVGVKALLTFPDHGGNLGAANLAVGFKPPNGIGLEVDAGVVVGGGYIFFDPDKGEYAGVLELSLAGIVTVKVIGLLDTILPDGSHGFSFLLIITTDFPPIQLSFGFTLNGVGGIGGVNRTMVVDALHTGFRAHTLNSILFPPDPIANAPQIISNLRSFFPPANGRYLFGPMVEIGWGTPTLITLAVGVILEIPDPIRIVILGLIDAGLPTQDVALVELHIDVLGIIDFGAKTLSIDGSMYDSRLLIFSMGGDLALRVSWGDNPSFVFSLGGFNPHFNAAGLGCPDMQRLNVSIGDGDNPRLSCNSYIALTSNSAQFGSNVQLYASAAGFTVTGYLGFDLLFIFSPFSFEFDFSAGFDVSFEGVDLCGISVNGLVAGPHPWHVHGDASLHILFFSVSASFDITWGDPTPAILPKKPVLPPLLAALTDPRSWSAELPDGATQSVSFVTRKPDDKALLVHPMGRLAVHQVVVPLDQQIAKFGNATPSDGNLFSIPTVKINGSPESEQPLQDYFAAGQYFTLSDADKIGKPSFEYYNAGVKIGSSDLVVGADSPRTVVYEERYIDVPEGLSRFSRFYQMTADIHLSLSRQGAGFQSSLKNSGLPKYVTPGMTSAVAVNEPQFVIASTQDLSVRADLAPAEGAAYFAASVSLSAHLAAHPEEAGNLQIIPIHEAAA
jgi:hypothetical protein